MTDPEQLPAGKRRCPTCQQPFNPNPRSPTHTYCSDRCRSAAWYERRGPRRPRSADPVNAVTNGVDEVTAMTNAVDASNENHPEATGVNAVQLCPHCRQPISLVTLVVTPTAAHVTVPELPRAHQRHGPT